MPITLKTFTVVASALVVAAAAPGPWCPTYHTITNHYDPSGPIQINGTWHVFPDGCEGGWCHYVSTDLLRWKQQKGSTFLANSDTGSLSVTEQGIIALFPHLAGPQYGLDRQIPKSDGSSSLTLDSWSNATHAVDSPRPHVGVGFRDPTRALKIDGDENWYVGVGSGFGGENNSTSLPGTGTGCLAWMRSTSKGNLSSFEFAGCLLENNHTTGHMNPSTVSWQDDDKPVAFFECPDVFSLSSSEESSSSSSSSSSFTQVVILASFYNWKKGAYFTNEWFTGSITNNTFQTSLRGLLDYGQYYAARSGTTGDVPSQNLADSRRVLFGATGWHNPPGMDSSCTPQIHLIPRDLGIDAVTGGLTISPIPELETLRVSTAASTSAASTAAKQSGVEPLAKGARQQLQMNCSWSASDAVDFTLSNEVVGFQMLSTTDRTAYTTVGFNMTSRRLFVDHRKSSQAHPSTIIQTTAPDVVIQKGETTLTVDVLVDGALVEIFGNHRAVISSFVTELMEEGVDVTPPEDRCTFAMPSPAGVRCSFSAYELVALK